MLNFYDQQGRKDLPWQLNKSAYTVWVSEIMLQQTQVKTVIPYFQRFIEKFSTIEALANAELDQVLKLWEGLGYYSRARNLHVCAKQVVSEFGGKFPTTLNEIVSLPGIGESTGGAILSLAYGLPEAILDGNVKRVLARVFLVDGWYGKSSVSKRLWQLSRKYTHKKRTGDFNQAMMDLGAGICNRSKPQCQECPLAKVCQAHIVGKTVEYPHRKPKKSIPTKQVALTLSCNAMGQVQLEKRPPSGIWGGLWSLPAMVTPLAKQKPVGEFKHTFSHYHMQAKVFGSERSGDTKRRIEENPALAWHNIDQISRLALPTPIKKFLYQHFRIEEN